MFSIKHPSPREQNGSHILNMPLIYLLFNTVTSVSPCSRHIVLVLLSKASPSLSNIMIPALGVIPTSDLRSEGTSDRIAVLPICPISNICIIQTLSRVITSQLSRVSHTISKYISFRGFRGYVNYTLRNSPYNAIATFGVRRHVSKTCCEHSDTKV